MAGKRREDYFQLVPLSPFYRIFDHTGRSFDYNDDEAFTLAQIAQRSGRPQRGLSVSISSMVGTVSATVIPSSATASR